MVEIDRRRVLRLGVLGLTALGTSIGVARLGAVAGVDDGTQFSEVYRGRRIRGVLVDRGRVLTPRAYVDDVELHLMRLATGDYTTPMNHYQTFRVPRLAARAAVDSLNGASLLPFHR